ncbi:hypothetical protein Tco_1151550 [Tanacetum coccineum]
MDKDPATPFLIGRGILATANAVIDYKKSKIAVGEGVTRSIFRVKEISLDDEEIPYWTILGKEESYKPRPSTDGVGALSLFMLRNTLWNTICLGNGNWPEMSYSTRLKTSGSRKSRNAQRMPKPIECFKHINQSRMGINALCIQLGAFSQLCTPSVCALHTQLVMHSVSMYFTHSTSYALSQYVLYALSQLCTQYVCALRIQLCTQSVCALRTQSACALRTQSACALRTQSACALRTQSACVLRTQSVCDLRTQSACALRTQSVCALRAQYCAYALNQCFIFQFLLSH